MHELGVVFHVIKMVEEIALENKLTHISRVTLKLGEVSGVIEYYLRDVWKWAVDHRSTYMQGCALEIEPIPALTYCQNCGSQYKTVEFGKNCPNCGSAETYLLQGNEFMIKEIEGA